MTEDDHSTTITLKKSSPFWWWVRGNPSIVLTLCGLAVGTLYSWHDVKTRIDAVEKKVDKLSARPEISSEDFADLKEKFAQLRTDSDKMLGRWQMVDSVPELSRGHRATKHPP